MEYSFKLSFCIPTLNRADFLLETLCSINIPSSELSNVEICIFNNGSETEYKHVEEVISQLVRKGMHIRYQKGTSTVPIDDSMIMVMNMALGEYLFCLGDDDILLPNTLSTVLSLLNNYSFDLLILNGIIFNEKNNTRDGIFKQNSDHSISFKDVVLRYKNNCSFGNIIINRKCVLYEDQNYLRGTSHSYGSFWLKLFSLYEEKIEPKILIVNEHIVCLRAIQKTYNILQVTFEHTLLEIKLYKESIGARGQQIMEEYEDKFWQSQARFTNLLKYSLAGNDLLNIKRYNHNFYTKFLFKIYFAVLTSFFLKPVKPMLKYLLLKIRNWR